MEMWNLQRATVLLSFHGHSLQSRNRAARDDLSAPCTGDGHGSCWPSVPAEILHGPGFLHEFGLTCAWLLCSNLRSRYLWKFMPLHLLQNNLWTRTLSCYFWFFCLAGTGSWFYLVLETTNIFLQKICGISVKRVIHHELTCLLF